jgi:hypothetical protein
MMFVLLTAVTMKKTELWDVKPERSLNMEVAGPSKIKAHIYRTIWCDISDDE